MAIPQNEILERPSTEFTIRMNLDFDPDQPELRYWKLTDAARKQIFLIVRMAAFALADVKPLESVRLLVLLVWMYKRKPKDLAADVRKCIAVLDTTNTCTCGNKEGASFPSDVGRETPCEQPSDGRRYRGI